MKRTKLLYVGACLFVVIIVGFSAVFYFTQNSEPKTAFEVFPIATPGWNVELEKPAAYMNVSIKNNGDVNQTDVSVKILGGFSNSSGQVPDQLFWVTTENISVIASGETVTTSKIYDFGWYFFYRFEVSSSGVAKETFDQWVTWRSWTDPMPTG